jgi:hypothetical protein
MQFVPTHRETSFEIMLPVASEIVLYASTYRLVGKVEKHWFNV